ncbi:hypothetical protein [Nonlabens sp. YIK11]|uniref:hypothetical protein n=1 Tax=Nonlabens sp. YIK11 TaxID=1453349 RepID=UPI000A5CA0CC|nr:hypothetical protein [Nonlabens sp. YIK11]
MKKIICTSLIALFSLISIAQITEAPADKSVVYFVRSSGMGALINFTYFDMEEVIAQHNGTGYVRYECEPGEHLFWARSENKVYLKADLKPGKTYVVQVQPTLGMVKSGVQFKPLDVDSKFKRIVKIMNKKEPYTRTEEEQNEIASKMVNVIERGMEKYNGLLNDNYEFETLNDDNIIPVELLNK